MVVRVLPVAAPLVSLLFLSTSVVAQVSVTAICTLDSFSWTFNSFGQSPCTVAAYMIATCYGGSYTLAPLVSGYAYPGPSPLYLGQCECSTIGYSLISACDACQGANPFDWSTYITNCTSTLPPSQFPNVVPSGVYVPHWATLDVTGENGWDASAALQAGDNPEYGPGTFFGPNGASTTYWGPTSTGPPPPPGGKSSNAGAIAGGVVGGIAAISIAVAVIFYLRRRRSRVVSTGVDASQPVLNDEMVSQSSTGSPLTMKFYDPDDPSTFPGSQDDQRSLDIPSASQGPSSPHVASGDTQTSLPHTRGYHGLPMPMA